MMASRTASPVAALSGEDWHRAAPPGWWRQSTAMPAGRIMRYRGSEPQVTFVLSGWVGRVRVLEDGRRQILELLLPGDHDGVETPSDDAGLLIAIGQCRIASIPRADVRRACEVSQPFRSDIDTAERRRRSILEERVVSLGQRSALARVAHLFCEVFTRSRSGEGAARQCDYPMSQMDLADTLGLSSVHVNRMLQALRSREVADLGRGWLKTRDFHGLAALCGFCPGYLAPKVSEAALPQRA